MLKELPIFVALFTVGVGGARSAPASADHAARMAASLKQFTGGVRAILVENCVDCHGGKKTRSNFDLTDRDGLLAGGDQGLAVRAGEPERSPLLDYLRHHTEPHMPAKQPKLPDTSIDAIEKWIELGAAYDKPLVEKAAGGGGGPLVVTEEDRAYWAFAPLRRAFGGKKSIDDFIDSGDAASRRALGRRLHFDLTGLPPGPGELDRFVADKSPAAYGQLVERLLASERFGEKWARHWLDVARFAESHGFEQDYDRKFAFHYRDFVIRAFNSDMPYDQFVQWQLAGDEIAPDNPLAMMATGFLGAGVFPTQITISEAERIRYDALDDMLATTGSAMLATTIGCARCHDHKYDPIPISDYYQMLSAFTTTVRSDVDLDLAPLDAESDTDYAAKHATLKAKLAKYETEQLPAAFRSWWAAREKGGTKATAPSWAILKPSSLKSQGGAVFKAQADGSHLATGPSPNKDVFTFTTVAPFGGATAIRLEALSDKSMVRGGPGRAGNGNIQLTGFEVTAGGKKLKLGNPRATFQQNTGNLAIKTAIDGNAATGWALDPQFGKNHAAIFDIGNPADLKAGAPLVITMRFDGNTKHVIGRPRLALSNQPPAGLGFGGGQDPRVTAEQQIATLAAKPGNEAAALEHFKILDSGYQKIAAELAALEATRKKSVQKVMICSDGNKVKPMRHHTSSGSIPNFYQETYHLSRGDNRQKGEVAKLGFLQVLSRGPAPDPEGGRSAIAGWITDVEKGAGHLLARVVVNRIWQHYMGEGIVATPNDFGFQGERPSEPELLDWLAVQLIDNGWSLKHIHRLVLNSEAYRAKRAPRRLEAEAIRDNALAVSGLLDWTMYGPGTLNEGMRRRSIYFMIKRSKMVPIMQMFDWPDTLTSLGRRAVTTTPSQALAFINNPHMRAMAEGFAKRVENAAPHPAVAAYRLAYGRNPSEAELARAKAFLTKQYESHGKDKAKALADFCAALMSANEFIYIE